MTSFEFYQLQAVTLSIVAWNFHDNISGIIDSFELDLRLPFETMPYAVTITKKGHYELGVITFSFRTQQVDDTDHEGNIGGIKIIKPSTGDFNIFIFFS